MRGKFAPLVYKLESIHLYTYTNFTEILPGTHGDVAMKCCPIRENKIILLLLLLRSFFSPLIHVFALPPAFRGKYSH